MVKSSVIKLSVSEYNLITAMDNVRFGEMFGVEIGEGEPEIDYRASQAEQDLIFIIRSGVQYIDILTIHNGQPTLAELDEIIFGFRCRRKIRFPLAID